MPTVPHVHRHTARTTFIVLSAALLISLVGSAGCEAPLAVKPVLRPVTREMLDTRRVDFDGRYARGMVWLADGEHYLHRRGDKLQRVAVLTGESEPDERTAALEAALSNHEDFGEDAARRLSRRPTEVTADHAAFLIEHQQRLYLYRFADDQLVRLTDEAESREVIGLSPNGDAVSFVRGNNLLAIDTRSGQQRQLTQDGSDTILNGILDWVYQEEVYGRGQWSGHWWRDDAEYIAFMQLDETNVPVYSIADYMPHMSEVEQTHYPKAGDPLPTVRLAIAQPQAEETVWVDLSKYAGTDILIVRGSWSPHGTFLFSVQDREQRWLELNEADPADGSVKTLIREESPAWTENLPHPHWLADGSFLWLSDRDGYRHIYHYTRDGQLLRRLTNGEWAVRGLIGHDAETDWVYFTGARETVLEEHAYRVRLAGGEVERLTESGFDHRVSFDPTFHYFFDTFSNIATPRQVHLRNADGSLLRLISENRVAAIDEYAWSVPELLQIPNRDGRLMNVELIRPPHFDASKKYPVLCDVYGGPDAPTVRNRWGGNGQLNDQYLAQQGYIIWRCDPYSATGGVATAAWDAYCSLGENELDDIEDSLAWLIDQGYADPERIGITGFSYGGYLAAYALTHSKLFKMGIAGALLSDWRNYDAIYVERYMQTPEHNHDGYERAGVSNAAADLHGRLLIVHGLLDDNVHFQNAAQFLDALQRADRMFDLMIYPRDRHGIGYGSYHFRDLSLNYIRDNL